MFTNQILILCMQYHSFTTIWVRILFLFSSFQGKFFSSPRTMAFFRRYDRRQLSFPSNLLISLSTTSVTTCSDCCYHWQFNPKLSYFHLFAGGRVAAVHEEASPNDNEKLTTIHHWLLVPRGRFARGGVPQMFQYIGAPPQNRPRSGDAKQILSLMRDAAALEHAPMPKLSPIVG